MSSTYKRKKEKRKKKDKRKKERKKKGKRKLLPKGKKKELKKGVVYIRHDECHVNNKTKCYVYFDARYVDTNMRYDDKTDSWFYYATPGLFRNATKVRFVDSINRWMPEQPHPHITII